MELLLERTLNRTSGHSPEYVLAVNLVCTPEELTAITDHRLTRQALFAVPERDAHHEQADRAFARSDARANLRFGEASKLLLDTLAGLYHAVCAHTAYTLTVADAIAGTTVRCPDLFELLGAERSITEAFDTLDRTVHDALAFTYGREQILTPDGTEDPVGVPPAHWSNPQRWGR
jgi:hypothetical protein